MLDLAATVDVLVVGEPHGSQEVPRLLAGLLIDLAALGYRGMVDNLLDQWARLCPAAKVLAIRGNLHARLRPHPALPADLWPSFARQVADRRPDLVIGSLDVAFCAGWVVNLGRRPG